MNRERPERIDTEEQALAWVLSDIESVSPMVSTLVAGMSTALYTTLVGAILNLWLMANYRLLAGGTAKLITGLIEFGEHHAES